MMGETRAEHRLRKDRSNMMGRVTDFPDQLRAAMRAAQQGPELMHGPKPSRIYVVGMGGSAIGGDFLRAFAEDRCAIPIEVIRGYDLPAAADASTFAFFVSYSGNTEETLSAWHGAARRGVRRACVTSGGQLQDLAERAGAPVFSLPGGSPPRAALGWTSIPVFHAIARAGWLPFTGADLEEAARASAAAIDAYGVAADPLNSLRVWAETAAGRLPVVYAAAHPFYPAATRWVCQFNENAKTLAHAAFFPEQNHNEIIAWESASDVMARAEVAFLTDDAIDPRVRRRLEIVEALIVRAAHRVARFRAFGDGVLAKLFSFATMGDLASVYMADALGVDPTPIANIDRLKAELSTDS
jgi:glucose/mannose-6-phosphate isomerase